MCTVCGCGSGETRIEGSPDHAGHDHEHVGPGSGKTTLLVRTLTDLRDTRPMAVIEGDQQTNFDA